MSAGLQFLSHDIRALCQKHIEQVKAQGIDIRVIQTWRPVAEQAKKYRCTRSLAEIEAKADEIKRRGRPDLAELLMSVGPQSRPSWLPHGNLTNAGPGESLHHKIMLPGHGFAYSYAYDIACFVHGGTYITDGNAPEYQEAGKIGMALGLDWLGLPDSPFKESAHFEMQGMPALPARLMMVEG